MRPYRSTPQTNLIGAALIAAPALLLASTAVSAAGGGLGEDQAGGVIQVYAMAGFALVVFGLTGMLAAPFPRTAAALLVIGAVGTAGGVAYGIDSIYDALGTFSLNDDVEGAAAPLGLQLPGALFPLAFIGLGAALMRARIEPRSCGALLVAAGVCFPLSRIPSVEPLAIAVDLLFLIALAPLGWAMLQGRVRGAHLPADAEPSPAG